jgi:hypothetical protein
MQMRYFCFFIKRSKKYENIQVISLGKRVHPILIHMFNKNYNSIFLETNETIELKNFFLIINRLKNYN